MKYKIICQKCKGNSQVNIIQDIIEWIDVKQVISGRKRLDGNWGWQCLCGNNSILTSQEKRNISNPAQPTALEVKKIIKNIKAEQVVDTKQGLLVNNFIMQELR